jgi:hypothetical protein
MAYLVILTLRASGRNLRGGTLISTGRILIHKCQCSYSSSARFLKTQNRGVALEMLYNHLGKLRRLWRAKDLLSSYAEAMRTTFAAEGENSIFIGKLNIAYRI